MELEDLEKKTLDHQGFRLFCIVKLMILCLTLLIQTLSVLFHIS